ncbi:hypothetical protein WN944_004047 [Citrus x changshan-huyou]|uniref:Uncharacterized protein n=1 Tax=Citrus x changshan-huyou TaxID=2935761 RepID=A0AAP0QHF9_9ROSI
MALNLMLRRASSSVLPCAIRAVGSQRTFRSAVSAVLRVEKTTLSRRTFIPLVQRFSTKPSSDENLIRVIESEIDCAEQPTVSACFHFFTFFLCPFTSVVVIVNFFSPFWDPRKRFHFLMFS